MGRIEVNELPASQVKELLNKDGLDLKLTKRTYTLAEVYEMKRTSGLIPKNIEARKLGFGSLVGESREVQTKIMEFGVKSI